MNQYIKYATQEKINKLLNIELPDGKLSNKIELAEEESAIKYDGGKSQFFEINRIYDWFKNNNLHFKTLPVEKRGYAKANDSIIMEPRDLVDQFESVYRYWITDKGCHISYSTFEEFANLRRDVQHRKFWFGRKIALNPDGQLYVFGRPNDVNYRTGSPYDIENLSDCFDSEGYAQYLNILEEIRNSRCGKCESNGVCGGVNINIAYLYVDDMRLIDYSCMQSNMLFQRILDVNDEIIQDFKIGNSERQVLVFHNLNIYKMEVYITKINDRIFIFNTTDIVLSEVDSEIVFDDFVKKVKSWLKMRTNQDSAICVISEKENNLIVLAVLGEKSIVSTIYSVEEW